MELVLEENCTGAVVQTQNISWNATGNVSATYALDREQNYCARLVIGERTVTTNLGRLNHAHSIVRECGTSGYGDSQNKRFVYPQPRSSSNHQPLRQFGDDR